MVLRIFLCLCAICSLAVSSPASDDASRTFAAAKGMYQRGAYDSTARLLQAFMRDHGKDTADEYLIPLLLESSVRKGDWSYVRRVFSVYQKRFPSSTYLPRLWYLDGLGAVREKNYPEALAGFSLALRGGVSPAIDSLIAQNLQLLCEKALSPEEVSALADLKDLHPRVAEIMSYYDIKNLYGEGAVAKVDQNAEKFKQSYPRSSFLSSVNDLMGRLKQTRKGPVPIGVLAPLSGYDAEIGKQIVQGVQVAVDNHNAMSKPEVKLIISDTRGSMVETARKTLDLLSSYNVSMIVGPILSQEAVVSACLLRDKDAVMISPTATDEGISELGGDIYQMNVTLGALGRSIARYALDNLHIREFAVVAPLSEYGQALTRTFVKEVQQCGAEIIAQEYFEENDHDFRFQFESIRKKIAARRYEKMSQAMQTTNIGRTRRADSLYLADSVMELGGIFIPAEMEQVVMLAPQVFFNKLKAQLLGSTGWHNPKTIADGKRYVANAIFSTNLPTGTATPEWSAFSAAYQKKFKAEPDRIAALGYDALQLYLMALRKSDGNTDPHSIGSFISSVKNLSGASGRISIDPGTHTNTEAAIMRISENQFIRLQ
jgi:ABC-type branched-subunit amino acid transport system substrate-binding protein